MSGVAISLLTVTALLLAAIPAVLTLVNLKVFLPAPEQGGRMDKPGVSVLVPARNEAAAIEPCVQAILVSRDVDLEVVVLDDASTDGTELVVVESRMVIGEPQAWFQGSNLLRSKIPIITQDGVRTLRRRLAAAR